MPTFYTDQAYLIDPIAPPPVGTILTFETITIEDRNDNGVIGPATGGVGNRDRIEGSPITGVYVGDTITVRLTNGDVVTITGVTFYTNDGGRYFTPTDSTILQNGVEFLSSTFVNPSTSIPVSSLLPICFTPGTRILTPDGDVPVESLAVGDLVVTLDRGPQPVRWIGRRSFPGHGRSEPVRIAAGALGNAREMRVSRQHRFLLRGWRADLHFGESEVLVAVCHLLNGTSIAASPCAEVDYIHLLFDRHEIIFAEGAPTESFHPGDWVLSQDREVMSEVLALFPELVAETSARARTARPVVRGRPAMVLSPAA
jgi:hypothetical protein